VAVLCATGLSACELPSSKRQSTRVVTPTASQTPPAGTSGLDGYYNQSVTWTSCGANECARVKVPVDYADPAGASIGLAVLRVPASGDRVGSLVVNPGGPGASGVDYAAGASQIVSRSVRRAYDIVGFDPRGTGRSSAINCVTDRELDAFIATDPTPDDPAEEQAFAADARAFAGKCKVNGGPLLGHVSTIDAAKDMDILRAVLGDAKLNYLGKSYGTLLGSVYAGLFPRLVGRFVLDGVVPPDLSNDDFKLGQAEGFERATRAWAQSCVAGGDCALGTSVDQVMQGLRDLLESLDADPVTNTGDPSVPKLTEGWAAVGIAEAMYSKRYWPDLDDAFRALVDDRDGSGLMALANQYAQRNEGGHYYGTLNETIWAVNCLDRPETSSLPDLEKFSTEAQAKAPTWGRYLAWGSLPCAYWPVKAKTPSRVTAQGSGLIVVVGTTRDPATPYEWSVRLHEQLSNSTLISYDGDGHTAYKLSNSCVDNAIDAYYLKGTPPPPDLKC
jgi:pimeloyl-ACP methyl ester carboxylesterase